MEELNVIMKDILGQRMCSYVDCFKPLVITEGEAKSFYFKNDINKIIFKNMTIKCDIGFRYIEVKGRIINVYDNNIGSLITIDVSNGFINILPVEGEEDALEIKFVEFRKEQIQYEKISTELYPFYGLSLIPTIYNNAYIYNITVTITMSPADETLYKVSLILPLLSKGIDGVVDSAIDLYNTVLSKDFGNFFTMEKVKIFGYGDEEMSIIDHHYTEETFLVQNSKGDKIQIPFSYYFNNSISSIDEDNSTIFDNEVNE